MENRTGCLGLPWNLFSERGTQGENGIQATSEIEAERDGEREVPVPVNRNGNEAAMTPSIPSTSVEVFAMPGHGRTSFLWAMLFMLRQLSRVWPGYLCWPLDEPTGRSLLDIHEKLRLGLLPDRWKSEEGSLCRHALHLRNMNPWGERHFVVWDWPDSVFASDRLGSVSEKK